MRFQSYVIQSNQSAETGYDSFIFLKAYSTNCQRSLMKNRIETPAKYDFTNMALAVLFTNLRWRFTRRKM